MPGFVDRCWPEAKLILEIDGRRWHARERDMAKDRARDREAARLGWQTVRVLDEEVGDCLGAVVDDMVTIYAERLPGSVAV
jgi:very-short-patch-repair endonuclease